MMFIIMIIKNKLFDNKFVFNLIVVVFEKCLIHCVIAIKSFYNFNAINKFTKNLKMFEKCLIFKIEKNELTILKHNQNSCLT